LYNQQLLSLCMKPSGSPPINNKCYIPSFFIFSSIFMCVSRKINIFPINPVTKFVWDYERPAFALRAIKQWLSFNTGVSIPLFLISQLKKTARAFAAQFETGSPRAADLCKVSASFRRGRPRVCTRYNCRARIMERINGLRGILNGNNGRNWRIPKHPILMRQSQSAI